MHFYKFNYYKNSLTVEVRKFLLETVEIDTEAWTALHWTFTNDWTVELRGDHHTDRCVLWPTDEKCAWNCVCMCMRVEIQLVHGAWVTQQSICLQVLPPWVKQGEHCSRVFYHAPTSTSASISMKLWTARGRTKLSWDFPPFHPHTRHT